MWMYKCLLVTAVVAAAVALDPLESDDIIDAVNSAQTTWKAGRNFHPGMQKSFMKKRLGLRRLRGTNRLPKYTHFEAEDPELPETFDARHRWPNCPSIGHIWDQGPCGSCWGVSAAATFTDRLCIATNGSFTESLSAEQLISCCTECGYGCNGGYDDHAWLYFQETGIVTGGDYKSHKGCQPYKLPGCNHVVDGVKRSCARYGNLPTPVCKTRCNNKKYMTDFKQDLHRVKSTFTLNDVGHIMHELFKNGPVQAGLDIYDDFTSYKSGVYAHIYGYYMGYHAVKIIGWGVEDGTPYWLVANSWNSDWGDQGFIKILRGGNECNIETDVSGGIPDV